MAAPVRIAIHPVERSFSTYWQHWCDREGIDYVTVNAYRSDIVEHLKILGCDGFMWHWHQDNFAEQLFARQLTAALEAGGIKVFPSVRTSWHFDDKVGQKYLLESIGVPFVDSHVFYEKATALAWLQACKFPIVHKLRGGAGSTNVRLVRDVREARRIVQRAFTSGFAPLDLHALTRDALWRWRRDRDLKSLLRVPYSWMRAVLNLKPRITALRPRERGYVYFQEFLEGNAFDDRFVVIGDRCFCVRRRVRTGDFRASGSGMTSYDRDQFPPVSIALAFAVAEKIGSQSLALDVIYDALGDPKCVEVSYAFPTGPFLERAGGYFDRDGEWHDTDRPPPEFMIEDFVASMR